jgi:hypothetical protein
VPSRLWIVAAGRVYRSEDRASRWQPVGAPIPDQQATARGFDVLNETMLVITDRGLFRSQDSGATWTLVAAELPSHSEATLLVRDPHAPATIYAGFSRMGPEQLKQVSATPDEPYAWRDIALLVAVYTGLGLLLLGMGLIVRRMTREDMAIKADRSINIRTESQ